MNPTPTFGTTEDETLADIVDCYRRVWDHADATIDALALDAAGRVPWWRVGEVTLHRILVLVLAETNRHGGHAYILREQLDGAAGLDATNTNMPDQDPAWWQNLHTSIEHAAKTAQSRSTTTPDD